MAADVPSRFVRQPSEGEHSELIRLRGAGPRATRVRAALILLSSASVSVPEIERRLGLSRPTVTHWLHRFERSGVAGLLDRPRSGRPSRISSDVLRHITMVVGARPRDLGIPGTQWSVAKLRQYLVQSGTVPAVSRESLRVTLKRAGLDFASPRVGQIQKGVTTMIPGAFEYHAPSSLGEATALLAKLGDDAKVLSGGQSLIPLMKLRLASPRHLVDINGLPGLAYVREDGGSLRIGGLTREADLEESDVVRRRYPLLFDTCKVIADPIVRNMATVGGNLAHGDPANDHPATMLAFGAEIVAVGPGGERQIPIGSFFTGPFTTALKTNEIVVEIRVPSPKPGSGGAYVKMERKVGDFATAAVAVQLTLGASGACEDVGIGLTNVGSVPIKAVKAEAALKGKRPDEAAIKQAAQLAAEAAQPAADLRGSVEYKRDLVRVLTGRALRRAIERAQRGG
ncbi:MAG TPA: FAD binding domain-containing protein [Gemmatimonadaceae bacterium]|nr:FAD binding domain-containing protein [Gemmatimonadaceae bacterium]